MTTDTTREGAGVPGLLEMSELLRARGVDVCNWAEQAVAEAAWKAAKADELAFLENTIDEFSGGVDLVRRLENRLDELKGESRG